MSRKSNTFKTYSTEEKIEYIENRIENLIDDLKKSNETIITQGHIISEMAKVAIRPKPLYKSEDVLTTYREQYIRISSDNYLYPNNKTIVSVIFDVFIFTWVYVCINEDGEIENINETILNQMDYKLLVI